LRWRRLRNEVKGVEVGGQWIEEPNTVRIEAKKLFDSRFKATKDLGVRLDNVDFKSLSLEDNMGLIKAFYVEEVRDAMWLCDGSKSPGPDGFNLFFVKEGWDVFKDEIVEALALFHETGCIPKGCNASFVALVPKVRDPAKLEQYRPISLVGLCTKLYPRCWQRGLRKCYQVL